MDFSQVIAELQKLNAVVEPINRGQLDLIRHTAGINKRLDNVTKALTGQTEFAKDQARREQQEERGDFKKKKKEEDPKTPDIEGGIIGEFLTGLSQLGAAVGAGALAFAAVWPRISNTYEDTLGEISEGANSFLMSLVGFSGFLTSKFTLTTAALTSVGKTIKGAFGNTRMWKSVGTTLSTIGQTIGRWFNSFMTPFKQLAAPFRRNGSLGRLWRMVRNLMRPFTAIAGRLLSFFPMIRTFVMIFETIGGAFAALQRGGDLVDALRGGLEGFANSFVTVFEGMGELVANLAQFVLGFFLPEEQAQAVGDSIRGLVDGIGNVVRTVISFFGGIVEGILRIPGAIWEFFSQEDWMAQMRSGIVDGIGGVLNAVPEAFLFLTRYLRASLADMLRGIANGVGRIPLMDGAADAIRGLANNISERGVIDVASGDINAVGSAISGIGHAANDLWTGEMLDDMQDADIARDNARAERRRIEGEQTSRPAEVVQDRPIERAGLNVINAPSVSTSSVTHQDNRQTNVATATPARDYSYALQARGLR